MRIVFLSKFTPKNSYGGAEVSAWYTAKGLVSLGQEVFYFRQVEDLKKSRRQEYYQEGIKVFEIPGIFGRDVLTLEKLWAYRQAGKLKEYLPKDIDVIHSHDQHSLLINYALKKTLANKKTKYFHTVRDYTPICGFNHLTTKDEVCTRCSRESFKNCPKIVQAKWYQKPVRIYRFLTTIPFHQRCLLELTGVVFISKFLRREILTSPNWRERIIKPKSITVIYNPAPDWHKLDKSQLQANSAFRLLFVGRLEYHKGPHILFTAINLLAADARLKGRLSLDMVGGGDIAKYRRLTQESGIEKIVNFRGQVLHKDLPQVYAQADLLVLPSIWPEPFGRGIIEAGICVVPTLASDWAGPREIIKNNQTGWLFNIADSQALADKIKELALNRELVQRVGQNCREFVSDNFNAIKVSRAYLDFYQKKV